MPRSDQKLVGMVKPSKPLDQVINKNERKQLNLIEESQPNRWKAGDGQHYNERTERLRRR